MGKHIWRASFPSSSKGFFAVTGFTLIHDPEFQKELQEVDLLKAIKDPKQLSETKKLISEMKNYPLFDIDSLGIFLAVPSTTLEKLCKLNKYYETIAYLTSNPLYFKTFQEFAQKLYIQRRENTDWFSNSIARWSTLTCLTIT